MSDMMRENPLSHDFDLTPYDASTEAMRPQTADAFARVVIHAICQASVKPAVGRRTFERCMQALMLGSTSRAGFRHPGKAKAIDLIWRERARLFDEYETCADKRGFIESLPWVGSVTGRALDHALGLHGTDGPRPVSQARMAHRD